MKNPTAMQYFEWYLPADGRLWRQAEAEAARLAAAGITALWLPPAYKGAAGREDVGYGVYDLYDLGEFAQRGTVATKYGTKAEYLAAIQALQREGIAVWADAVLDHRMGADGTEQVSATPYDWVDRYRQTGPARTISAWTSFTFPGRGGAILTSAGTGSTLTASTGTTPPAKRPSSSFRARSGTARSTRKTATTTT